MFKEVQTIASQSLAWGMMPLEQWAKWTDDSQRSLKALIEQSKRNQDKLFTDAIEEVRFLETQAKSVWDKANEAVEGAVAPVAAPVQAKKPAAKKASAKKAAAAPTQVAPAEKVVADVEAVATVEVVEPAAAPAAVAEAQPVAAPADSAVKDDLTRISGVGPALEKKLNAAGFTRFEQIATLSAADIERLESTVLRFSGRIERDDWKGQAALFASQTAS